MIPLVESSKIAEEITILKDIYLVLKVKTKANKSFHKIRTIFSSMGQKGIVIG